MRVVNLKQVYLLYADKTCCLLLWGCWCLLSVSSAASAAAPHA